MQPSSQFTNGAPRLPLRSGLLSVTNRLELGNKARSVSGCGEVPNCRKADQSTGKAANQHIKGVAVVVHEILHQHEENLVRLSDFRCEICHSANSIGSLGLRVERMKIDLPYIREDRDRHGNWRIYVRRRGAASGSTPSGVRLIFWMHTAPHSQRSKTRLLRAALTQTPFAGLSKVLCLPRVQERAGSERTQYVRRGILDALVQEHGEKPFIMKPKHLRKLRDAKADTPEAANALVKALGRSLNGRLKLSTSTATPPKRSPTSRRARRAFIRGLSKRCANMRLTILSEPALVSRLRCCSTRPSVALTWFASVKDGAQWLA